MGIAAQLGESRMKLREKLNAAWCKRISLTVGALALLAAPASAITVIDSGYTGVGTFEITMEGDILAGTTNQITVSAPVGVDFMGYNLTAGLAGSPFGGLASGFLPGGQSEIIPYTNTGTADGILRAIFAFADSTWDGLSMAEQDSILAPANSSLVAALTTSGGTGSAAVPIPAAGMLLLAALGGLATVRRRPA